MPSHSSSANPLASLERSFDLGGFTLDPSDVQNPADDGNLQFASDTINSQTQKDVSSDLQSVDGDLESGTTAGFQVPILSDPTGAFQLLLGKSVPLFTYTTPALELDFGFSQFFPCDRPAGREPDGPNGRFRTAQFRLRYIRFSGVRRRRIQQPSQILDGLYVDSNASQLTLDGSIAAYAAVNLGILSAGVGGGLFAAVGLSPYDPAAPAMSTCNSSKVISRRGPSSPNPARCRHFSMPSIASTLVLSHTLGPSTSLTSLSPRSAKVHRCRTRHPCWQRCRQIRSIAGPSRTLLRSTSVPSPRTASTRVRPTPPRPPTVARRSRSCRGRLPTVCIFTAAECRYPRSNFTTFPANGLPDVIAAAGATGNDTVAVNVTGNINVNLVAGARDE